MTPKMTKALRAAGRAGDAGLTWNKHVGWYVEGEEEYHGGVIVSRLVWTHGFLAEKGKAGRADGSRRVITDKGRAHLAKVDLA